MLVTRGFAAYSRSRLVRLCLGQGEYRGLGKCANVTVLERVCTFLYLLLERLHLPLALDERDAVHIVVRALRVSSVDGHA